MSVFIFPLSLNVRFVALIALALVIVWNLRQLKQLCSLQRVILGEEQSYLVLAGNKIAIDFTGESRVLSSMVVLSCEARDSSKLDCPRHIVFFRDSVSEEQFHLLRVFVKNGKFNTHLSP